MYGQHYNARAVNATAESVLVDEHAPGRDNCPLLLLMMMWCALIWGAAAALQ